MVPSIGQDCPNCGTRIYDAKLRFCTHCGEALNLRLERTPVGNKAMAYLLGIICLPMGTCSLGSIGWIVISREQGMIGFVAAVLVPTLLVALMGILWMLRILGKE